MRFGLPYSVAIYISKGRSALNSGTMSAQKKLSCSVLWRITWKMFILESMYCALLQGQVTSCLCNIKYRLG